MLKNVQGISLSKVFISVCAVSFIMMLHYMNASDIYSSNLKKGFLSSIDLRGSLFDLVNIGEGKLDDFGTNTTLQRPPPPLPAALQPGTGWKTALMWGSWGGHNWSIRFGAETPEAMRAAGCPIWQCNFVYDKEMFPFVDAVLVGAIKFGSLKRHYQSRPKGQRWIWSSMEAPEARKPKNITEENTIWNPSFLINWTLSYHTNSDIVGFYGHFLTIGATQKPLLPNLMSSHPEAMKKYEDAIASGATLSNVVGENSKDILNKTKIVAWMSGHCPTVSKREVYIKELSKYMQIDTYGRCGTNNCGVDEVCWGERLRQYSFYMSMENKICDDYVTEKAYLPMVHKIVPVVWGGSDYSRLMPPGSYIDARKYHPRDLAELLTTLHNNPEEYSKFHLWRGFWQAYRGGSFCQLCHQLHTDTEEKHYLDLQNWRLENGNCVSAPANLFGTDRPPAWQKFLEFHNSTML